jgi:hypothetical protein
MKEHFYVVARATSGINKQSRVGLIVETIRQPLLNRIKANIHLRGSPFVISAHVAVELIAVVRKPFGYTERSLVLF